MEDTAARHTRFMSAALAEAALAEAQNEVPIGAVVTYGDMIIARAHNLTEALGDPTAHAEMQAITAATAKIGGKYLTGCTLYVTVEPCPMCAAALNWAQIDTIVYGCPDPKRGYSLFAPTLLHPKTKVVQGIETDRCACLIQSFFRKKRG